MTAFYTLFVLILGSAFGSFLNVVIYRIPAGRSILFPPSRCPRCEHRLGAGDNIPILGWLLLQGKCRYCRAPVSIRYPLVELLTAVLYLLVFQQFGWSLLTLGYWAFCSWLMALAWIDIDTMTLPDGLLKSGLVTGLLFHGLLGATTRDLGDHLALSVMGGTLGLWLFDLIRSLGTLLLQKEAMGDGDPYLAAMLGAWLGIKLLLLASFLASALGAFCGGAIAILGGHSLQRPLPFGPFLALGAILTLLWGDTLIQLYLRIFFPEFLMGQ